METNHKNIYGVLKCLLVLFTSLQFCDAKDIRLTQMRIKTSKITLSGFSSGGTMAQQLQISYSSLFSGIAVFSHTYYRCGPPTGNVDDYDKYCTKLGNLTIDQLYDPQKALEDIETYRKANLIENPRYLKNKKLYVYAGLNNFLFSADMSMRILNIYEPFIDNPANIKTRVQNAALLLPTDSFGKKCSENAQEQFFIGNCGFSGPLDALQFLLDSPETTIRKPGKNLRLEPLRTFDQKEFFTAERHDMDDIGFIYIPKGCQQQNRVGNQAAPSLSNRRHNHAYGSYGNGAGSGSALCHLHVYFHGCLTGRQLVGNKHIQNSGYLELAEENKIIMLFPNAITTKENEIGCWDTYGFTGSQHANQNGSQVRVVNRMIRRIIGDAVLPPVDKLGQYQHTTTIRNIPNDHHNGWGFGGGGFGYPDIRFPDHRHPLSP